MSSDTTTKKKEPRGKDCQLSHHILWMEIKAKTKYHCLWLNVIAISAVEIMGEETRMNYNFFIELNSLALIFVISRFSFSNRYIAIIFDYSIFGTGPRVSHERQSSNEEIPLLYAPATGQCNGRGESESKKISLDFCKRCALEMWRRRPWYEPQRRTQEILNSLVEWQFL